MLPNRCPLQELNTNGQTSNSHVLSCPRDCYRKIHEGKAYYVGKGHLPGESEKDRELRAAVEWMELRMKMARGEEGHEETTPSSPAKAPFAIDIKIPVKLRNAQPMAYDYSKEPATLPGELLTVPGDVTIDSLVDAFLAESRQQVAMGERAISTHREAKDSLADFQGFCRKYHVRHLAEIEPRKLSHFLKCYRDKQLELLAKGKALGIHRQTSVEVCKESLPMGF